MGKKSNETVFFEAFESGDIPTAKRLLRDVNPSSLKDWRTSEDRTCLHVALLAGDPDLLRKIAAKLVAAALKELIKEKDNQGDTALHLAVQIYRQDMVKQLLELAAKVDSESALCDCKNDKQETPLNMAIRLQFLEAVELLITRTKGALEEENIFFFHWLVWLNQVKLVEFLIKLSKDKKVDLSKFINQPYKPTANPPEKENPSDKEGNNPQHIEAIDGDRPLHIAARNKYEHMVNLLLKVPGVNKLARNSEGRTPFEIAREVMEYQESFRIIRKLAYYRWRPKPFMYCAPRVSHKKLMEARKKLDEAYKARRDAELVVAALLAAMTCAAAFTVPGGFDSEKGSEDLGSPLLTSFTSFKLFLVFDCIAFFLSLFACIMWEMSSELTTGDKMLFMTVNSLVVCWSFGFTAFGFMAAVYSMLARKVKTFSWVVLGSLIAITLCGVLASIRQSVHFLLRRARFHRLCGVSCFVDDIVEDIWCRAECWGLLNLVRSGEEVSRDLITGHVKFGMPPPEHEVSHNNSRSSSPFNPV